MDFCLYLSGVLPVGHVEEGREGRRQRAFMEPIGRELEPCPVGATCIKDLEGVCTKSFLPVETLLVHLARDVYLLPWSLLPFFGKDESQRRQQTTTVWLMREQP